MQFYTHPVGCKVICPRFGFRMGVLVNVNLLVSLPWYINFSFGFSFFLISEREMPPEIHFVTVVLLFSKQVATNSSWSHSTHSPVTDFTVGQTPAPMFGVQQVTKTLLLLWDLLQALKAGLLWPKCPAKAELVHVSCSQRTRNLPERQTITLPGYLSQDPHPRISNDHDISCTMK